MGGLEDLREFVRRGRDAQAAVDAVLLEHAKNEVVRTARKIGDVTEDQPNAQAELFAALDSLDQLKD